MGTITINVSDTVEHEFRDLIHEQFGTRKGTMGKAVQEALEAYVAEKRQKEIGREAIRLMNKGFKMGKILVRTRAELYEQ